MTQNLWTADLNDIFTIDKPLEKNEVIKNLEIPIHGLFVHGQILDATCMFRERPNIFDAVTCRRGEFTESIASLVSWGRDPGGITVLVVTSFLSRSTTDNSECTFLGSFCEIIDFFL